MTDLTLSGLTLLPDGQLAETTLFIDQGTIIRISPGRDPGADLIADGYIVPGLIDLQVNGAYGADFTIDAQTVVDVAARLPATGVTSFLPTIITSPFELYPQRLREIEEAGHHTGGAHVLGVHLEGPYLNRIRRGAHNTDLFRPIDVDEIRHWADPGIVRLVTLAPELPGALEAIRALSRNGIIVSAGHSNARYAEALVGFEAGITWGTHLFNAMREMRHREPGLPGALLSTSTLTCGLIADGIHVHPAMMGLAFRMKGAHRITLVTDAMQAMGMPAGRYKLGDREVVVDDTSARLEDGTLAGSILTLDQSVRNVVAFTGCAWTEAVTMASTTPARLLGLDGKGCIAPGCDADLVILNESLHVTHTWVAGQPVWETNNAECTM